MSNPILLAADIGATNSRFALFEILLKHNQQPEASQKPLQELWLPSQQYTSFQNLLADLKRQRLPFFEHPLDYVVIALPGPVTGQIGRPTQLPWIIDGQMIQDAYQCKQTWLCNDFIAQGYASTMRQQIELTTVRAVETPTSCALHAVVGAGTGLGKCLVHKSELLTVFPSEGGSADFPFLGNEEYEYALFLEQKYKKKPTTDAILSGNGLSRLFDFLNGQVLSPQEIGSRIHEHPETLTWFARFYGRTCKNYLLESLALDGLYITGGLASHLPLLDHPAFLKELLDCPTHRKLLEQTPVWHIKSQSAGLHGAAAFACAQLQKSKNKR